MKKRNGFLLIEVLMTLAILSLGIVLVLAALQKCLNTARSSVNYEQALHAAEGKLWELQALGSADLQGSGMFRYRMGTSDVNGLPFTSIRLSVLWDENNIEKEIWLNTYMEKKL